MKKRYHPENPVLAMVQAAVFKPLSLRPDAAWAYLNAFAHRGITQSGSARTKLAAMEARLLSRQAPRQSPMARGRR